ncbi:MAG: HPr family phosphocarrier protein [Spirochaetales bacterium]|nr:HPr family phosphocarrier protein [Spirochaetales bacterium]
MEIQEKVSFNGKNGFHARPAGIFSKKAKTYSSSITLVKAGETPKEADGKKLIQLMKMDIKDTDELYIIANGDDAKEACAELKELMKGLS